MAALHDLLDIYANRVQRTGQTGEPTPLIQAYKVPKPVVRQVVMDLTPLVTEQADQALLLVDSLWVEPYWEFRVVAATLLGCIRYSSPDLIFERVQDWTKPILEERLLNLVLNEGLSTLRNAHPDLLVDWINGLLDGPEWYDQKKGLIALLPLLTDTGFSNLPALYRLLQPLVRKTPFQLKPDMLEVVHQLAARSPVETAYYLRQSLKAPNNPDTAWLVRQSLSSFPNDLRQGLLLELRSNFHAGKA